MNIYVLTQKQFDKTNKALSEYFGVPYVFIENGDMKIECEEIVPWNKGKKGLQVAWNKGITGTKGKPVSEEKKKQISKKLMGHSVSKETRKKMSQKKLGKEPSNKGLKYPTVCCPHCNKSGASYMMKRYHFINCLNDITSN